MPKTKLRIKDLPASERPLEKLFNKGQENLSSVELLALLLGTGSSKDNALTLAKKLFKLYPSFKTSQLNFNNLMAIQGIGKTKAARVLAALELGERLFTPTPLDKTLILNTQDIIDQVKDISLKNQEVLIVLYLNAKQELIKKELVALGNLNINIIEPKEIFAPALTSPCSFIILAHNHPSSDPTPSEQDITFTKTLHQAGKVLGITLFDHCIVSSSGYFSFRENKLVKI